MKVRDVVYEKSRGVARITIDRPARGNAFRAETIDEMTAAFEEAARDASVGVVVLRGAGGRAFSTGGDLSWEGSMLPREIPHELRRLMRLSSAMLDNGKPVIAAIQGYCVGGGNQPNMLCDLSVATDDSRFGDGGARVGSLSFWWGLELLPRLVGDRRAREILFLCRHYRAEEALQMGWITRMVAPPDLDAAVQEWCDELLERSPQALRFIKAALNRPIEAQYPSVVNGGFVAELLHDTDEFREGMEALREKRRPRFVRGAEDGR